MNKLDSFVQSYKKQNDELIQSIDAKIARIVSYDDAVNAAKFIQLSLHKISARVALYLFLKQREVTILSRDLDEIVKRLEELVAFQMKLIQHPSIDLQNTERKENFSFWEEVDRKLLYGFVVKEHYLITMFYKVLFVDNTRWRIPITNLYCNIAISAQSLNDIEMFLLNDSSHYLEVDVVQQTIELTSELYSAAAQVCIETQSYDRTNLQWYSKALQFLYGYHSLLKILRNEDGLADVDARIEALQKRMESESKRR